jgi:hypothetical protein
MTGVCTDVPQIPIRESVRPARDQTLTRTNSRIALSNPSSVSGYIRPPIICRSMRIDT